jgi:MarR family 2-MHQ and catechol resistance regulon transcriptional repressor
MGTRYAGNRAEVRALNAYLTLMRASDSVSARAQAHLQGRGLTSSQFGVLDALWHLGPLCQCVLGEKLLRSGASITVVVDNLEKRGLVARERASEDRRFVTVSLTAKGRELVRKALPAQARAIFRELGVLTRTEQEALRRLCRKLGKGRCEKGGMP